MWLHAGLIHLASNMWGLVQAGFMAEKVHGWHVVLFLYVASGLMGNVVSAVFVPANVTVGASGAVFGLFGALWGGVATARRPLAAAHTLPTRRAPGEKICSNSNIPRERGIQGPASPLSLGIGRC